MKSNPLSHSSLMLMITHTIKTVIINRLLISDKFILNGLKIGYDAYVGEK